MSIITTQEELDSFIANTPMIANIYYNEQMEYVPINWDIEKVSVTYDKNQNHTTIERLMINE